MNLQIELTGTTPLVVHNIRLANPHDQIAQAIARITGKAAKQKTEQDAFEIEHLEWLGGLYYEDPPGYYLESRGIIRCFQEAAKATREGRDVLRALSPSALRVPIKFPHSDLLPVDLWKRPEYRFWKMVGIGKNRVPRMRPIFPEWSVTLQIDLEPIMLDLNALVEIVERAGRVEGLYEARTLGMGRFKAAITQVEETNGKATGRMRKTAPVEE